MITPDENIHFDEISLDDDLLIPADRKGRHTRGWLNFIRVFLLPAFWIIYPFRFFGKKKVPDGPYLYISNHYGSMDFIYPFCTTPECARILSKQEVLSQPFVGFMAKRVKVIPVARGTKDAKPLNNCLRCLKNGEKVVVFPEGTRNRTDKPLLPFKSGASVMAIKARVPVVPMLIYNRPKAFRMTHIIVGEPFELSDFYGEELTDVRRKEADAILVNKLMALREEHTAYLAAKKGRRAKKARD